MPFLSRNSITPSTDSNRESRTTQFPRLSRTFFLPSLSAKIVSALQIVGCRLRPKGTLNLPLALTRYKPLKQVRFKNNNQFIRLLFDDTKDRNQNTPYIKKLRVVTTITYSLKE